MVALYLNPKESGHVFSTNDFDLLGWIERNGDGPWSCFQAISGISFCGNEPNRDYAMKRVFDRIKIMVTLKGREVPFRKFQ